MISYRLVAFAVAAASAAAMLYVGLYQSRAVKHLWCPLFAKGCEAVADAPFARPFDIPDGYLGAGLYAAILVLLLAPAERWIWIPLLGLSALATLANIFGVRDMANLGSFCFYCVVTMLLSPVWELR
jgi:uncharacterized membrane protein